MMNYQSLLLRFLISLLIWFFTIFFMAIVMFFIARVFAFYLIGGDFLFSYMDIVKSFKIGVCCSLLCNTGIWVLFWCNKRN